MFRKTLKTITAVAFAGALAVGSATSASADVVEEHGSYGSGDINVLSNLCIGNWNGDVISILKIANSEYRELCTTYGSGSGEGDINVLSNICALNWDWNNAANLGLIANSKEYRACIEYNEAHGGGDKW
ncbi:hypothetical protein [Natronoglycomyces albus]|uniref:Uncharacterized protein n=1 Tax=Natronoglycomyces albus TaxID=2811108 RepID=A0A895XLM7_9ACTN|nr:hypothetical protein [Natronoglycomyces albus]QSB04319.1 hypothetical protein JQS30_10965 [Natronoglycomyces albus]